jgi:hypothetical protein
MALQLTLMQQPDPSAHTTEHTPHATPTTPRHPPGAAASGVEDARAAARPAAARHRAYAAMAAALISHGPVRLGGEITQGLQQGDLFQITAAPGPKKHGAGRAWEVVTRGGDSAGAAKAVGVIIPKLRGLETPVRAVVLPLLDHQAAADIQEAASGQLRGLLDAGSVWWQDASLYHATIYHASTHRVIQDGRRA